MTAYPHLQCDRCPATRHSEGYRPTLQGSIGFWDTQAVNHTYRCKSTHTTHKTTSQSYDYDYDRPNVPHKRSGASKMHVPSFASTAASSKNFLLNGTNSMPNALVTCQVLITHNHWLLWTDPRFWASASIKDPGASTRSRSNSSANTETAVRKHVSNLSMATKASSGYYGPLWLAD